VPPLLTTLGVTGVPSHSSTEGTVPVPLTKFDPVTVSTTGLVLLATEPWLSEVAMGGLTVKVLAVSETETAEVLKYRPICLVLSFQRKRLRIKQIGRYLTT
jgi:hypothetical protein